MVIFIVMSTVCFCPFVGENRRALRGEEPASMRETPESSVLLAFASTASLHDGRRKAAKAVSESAMWKFFILISGKSRLDLNSDRRSKVSVFERREMRRCPDVAAHWWKSLTRLRPNSWHPEVL